MVRDILVLEVPTVSRAELYAVVALVSAAALESDHSEVLTAYLGAMAKFHTYSFLCC